MKTDGPRVSLWANRSLQRLAACGVDHVNLLISMSLREIERGGRGGWRNAVPKELRPKIPFLPQIEDFLNTSVSHSFSETEKNG
jgi:hypothetical protein